MDHREIILQMEERKYDALRRALLARDTDPRAEMQEWLNVCYRELVPQQERELIEKQINEERQPGLSEAGTQPKFNVFRVIERGECHCFQVNDASVDALEIANRLYGYLSRETVGFAEQFEGWTSLTECRFIDQMMRCLCEDERVAGAFHIDLDTGTFSALDPENGWCTYPVRDAAEAARFSMGQDEVAREQCFQQKLAGKRINTDNRCLLLCGDRPLRAGDVEIMEWVGMEDGVATFTLELLTDEETVFGSKIALGEDTQMEIYASYDVEKSAVREHLDIGLMREIGSEYFLCPMDAETVDALRQKLDDHCMEQDGMHLEEGAALKQESGPWYEWDIT